MRPRLRAIGACLAIGLVPVLRLVPVLLLAGSVPARAAEEAELGDPALATDTIEEIIVTARRREEAMRETPVSLSVLTGEDLRELGARSLEDIGDAVPNLVFKQGTGKSASVTIRGVGQRDPRTFLDPSVGIYIDGVYTARADGPLISTLDVERIEVLRGPQGTLYGKNSVGGAINFITRKPGPEFEAFAELRVGNYDTFDTRLIVNLPLTDRLLSRWGFTSEHSDGWSENRITGQRYNDNSLLLGVGQLRLQASDSLIWDISGNYSKEDENPRAAQCRVSDPDNIFVGGFSEGGRIAFEQGLTESLFDHGGDCAFDSTLDEDEFSSNVVGHYELETWALSNVVTFEREELLVLENLTFQSITGYRGQDVSQTSDPDGSASLVLDFLQTHPTRQWQVSQEFRTTGEAWDGRVAYALGLFGFWEETKDGRGLSRFGPDGGFFLPCVIGPSCPAGAVPFPFVPVTRTEVSTTETEVESYAGYGQASVDLTDWLQLTGGVRYTWERKKVTLAGVGKGEETFDRWTPMATLKLTAPEDLLSGTPLDFGMFYFSYARGFKSGGFNGTPPVESLLGMPTGELDPFAQEELDNYEIGLKLAGLGDRVSLNLAFFHSDYENIQLTASAISGFLIVPRIENAGEATIRGFEIELQAVPFSGLHFQASLGFTDAQFNEFLDGVVDRSDEDFWNTPKLQFFAALQYRFELARAGLPAALGSLTPRVDMSYTSAASYHFQRAGFFAPGKPFEQGAYALWNARLTWLWLDERVRVSAYVQNAFDRRYFTGAIDLTETFGSGAVFFSDPRRFGVELGFRY